MTTLLYGFLLQLWNIVLWVLTEFPLWMFGAAKGMFVWFGGRILDLAAFCGVDDVLQYFDFLWPDIVIRQLVGFTLMVCEWEIVRCALLALLPTGGIALMVRGTRFVYHLVWGSAG